ncbi:G2/M phase-specific E3 ubiquitin-protein ligase [Chelonia mydas]|uniref:G2/M phase-specific E3 ubiquitin-protein ligase n=1 Tax=Chelonia mydas TaxID=8469 RepID=M7B3Q3_CHEMY|nr:G2/M phase-specific E3 ubiquitin-protein ligase [Chelonia mydas]
MLLAELPSCVLCQRTDDCPEKYGEKRTYKEYSLTVHYYCLISVWRVGRGMLVALSASEILGCKASRVTLLSYCWEHRPVQKLPSDESRGSSQCTICLEFVEHFPMYNILKSPCCKNAWFHRDCLQYQALSAGVFFFRCTVCNNKDKFQNEMLRMGIHIPEKDASWELEENAYQDLLQRYQHCDARRCLCRNGRDYNKPDRSPKMLCQNSLTPCTLLDLPASNKMVMSISPLINSSSRNLSVRRMQLKIQKREASNILRELKLQVNTKTTRLNINRDNIWNSALKGFRGRNFNPANTMEVKFTNCKGRVETDAFHGSKHEFFRLLMLHLQNSSLFEGSSSKNLSLDSQAIKENLYYEAGKMIAVSLVHVGVPPSFFSKTLFNCLVYGPENVKPKVEDVADFDVAQTIKMIKSSRTLASLKSTISDCYEYLTIAGCLRPMTTLCDKDMLVNDLLIYHVIKRVHSPFESFRQGLKTLGVLEKIQMHPDAFSSILCHKPERLSARILGDLFTIHCLSGVNKVKGVDFWMGYLQDVEGGESAATLEDILVFATGTSSIPPIGFEPDPSVKFLHIKYPVGNRQLNCLELPITKTYEQFKNKMDFAISNALRLEVE